MNDDSPIPIFLCSDENYFPHLCVVIASVVKNTNADIHFIVLTSSKSDAEKEKVARVCGGTKISFVSAGEYERVFASLPKRHDHISAATCLRYLIPQLDFPYDKGIYLDCDVVVCGDIRRLFNIDIGDAYVGGVYDYMFGKYASSLKIGNYFNAGVLLMNIKRMREENVTKMLINATLKMRNEIKYLDQDIMNIVLGERAVILPPKFGAISTLYRKRLPPAPRQREKDIDDAIYRPVAVHFTGPDKPWIIPYGITAHPWTPLYFYYLERTPYADLKAPILRDFKYFARLCWYSFRHILFFMRPHFWKMRVLYLKNKHIYAKG
ncbi:MAG: glycosyltransferase family 8 protein [Opitutales bacterium]|nr:glycosyltransferase family 8 protein [Opitutales bacterium]